MNIKQWIFTIVITPIFVPFIVATCLMGAISEFCQGVIDETFRLRNRL